MKYEVKDKYLGCGVWTEKSLDIPTGFVKLTKKTPQKILKRLFSTGLILLIESPSPQK